jgi:hypothetical protein
MMSKKQLQDITSCRYCTTSKRECSTYKNSVMCDCPQIKEVAKTALAYREMLERLEWVYDQQRNRMACPICSAIKDWQPTHVKNCELAALLGKVRGEG